ncbi:uncharacterized protein LOC122195221 [Lactuca sativa]|uniref:uncharacterized protein LOC122195221 n=1 Tax=Lactuca sativa TaxID=4236 RepID=UPI001C6901A3|nr:uncharacterized protein LOC122195221 [Lactuca sativa]
MTLVKSVLGNLPTFYLSLFPAPVGIIEELEKIQRGLTWRSDYAVDGKFCVARLRNRLDKAHHPVGDGEFWWLNSVPKKVTSFVWRAKQGRIPSAEALKRRNIPVTSPMCSLCADQIESADHILTSCCMAKETLCMVLNWCGIPLEYFSGVNEVLAYARNWGHCPKKKETLTCILYKTIWSLWKARNDRIFRGEISKPAKIVDFIKATVFTWRKYRTKIGDKMD